MLQASLQEVVQLDLNQAQQQLQQVMEPLMVWCQKNGFLVPSTPHVSHLIGIRPPPQQNMTPEQLAQVAKDLYHNHRIILAPRCGGWRLSPYLDTNPQDVEALVNALQEIFFSKESLKARDEGLVEPLLSFPK
eukprot:CAMPEP_0172463062 /NCGR_PEP_ID=MMETSP1065-20121228/45874_1 /TAXON_ID=265537 /ORGANISM="Amphiprora paludosa, Strain CCMP125" /LENGTH=132 /DNA_ID=CAMNT_0013218907 /DNA_START=1 /DNA_END=399 /DNA_ORIENTATION=+